MKSKFINVLMFAAGAAIGSAVTWKIVKDRYERIVQEEIESIKDAFKDIPNDDQEQSGEEADDEADGTPRQINWDELEDLKDEEDESSDVVQYTKLVSNYTSEKGGAERVGTAPYVIAPYDFGELDDYNTIELTYYADGVLEDDEYRIVTDIDELIGSDSLYTFGEYEDDAVFVRNEYLRTDFQILKDYRTYAEARSNGPTRVDDE